MNGLWMMVIAIVVLGGGYLFYGRWLAKTWGVDPNAKTPAYELQDGVDYEPADTAVVFGHQFASIAGAGLINGPIQAAVFGWVPVLLWLPPLPMWWRVPSMASPLTAPTSAPTEAWPPPACSSSWRR